MQCCFEGTKATRVLDRRHPVLLCRASTALSIFPALLDSCNRQTSDQSSQDAQALADYAFMLRHSR
jgi:hypothetical protein